MKLKIAGLCITLLAAICITKSARAQDWQTCNVGGGACLARTNSSTGNGLAGVATAAGAIGVLGNSTSGDAMQGYASGAGNGVSGSSMGAGNGVYGFSQGLNGVQGISNTTNASDVYGQSHSSGGYGVAGRSYSSGTAVYGDNANASGWVGYFNGKLYASSGYKPGGGSWTASSDARLKRDVKGLDGVLDRLLKLRGVTFEWLEAEKQGNLEGPQIGMIAQEVEKVFPEWVGTDAEGYKTLTFRGFEALAVEGMRTLNKDNQTLRLQVVSLEDRIKKLENNRPALMAGFGPGGLASVGVIALAAGMFLTLKRRMAS